MQKYLNGPSACPRSMKSQKNTGKMGAGHSLSPLPSNIPPAFCPGVALKQELEKTAV